MPRSKRKRKSTIGSRKRKRTENGQFAGTKESKNEIPSYQTDHNETTAKGSRADNEKTIVPQTPTNKAECIDTPAKPADNKNENRVVELQNMPMNKPPRIVTETKAKRSHTDEKKTVEVQAPNNKVECLDRPVKSIDKAKNRAVELCTNVINKITIVKEMAAKGSHTNKTKTVEALTLNKKQENVDTPEKLAATELFTKPKNETMNVKKETTAKGSHANKKKPIEAMTVNNTVEYLETPVKSPYDRKEYRVIKLPNGLRVLLIAVPNDPRTDGEWESDSDDSEVSISKAVFKPRDSRFEEGIRASCGVCIDVGKFNDPPGIPRMNEYLERLVANGSKKFPKEQHWIFKASCSGRFNNTTQGDQTIFSITAVQEYSLEEALDWLAQLLISPLMKREDVPMIRQNVEQGTRGEYEYLRDLESTKREELFRSLARPGHPATKLGERTAALKRKLTNDKLHEELLKFKKRHYSAHRMIAVIEAKFSLDTLEKYAIQYFSAIPCNGLPPEDFSQFKDVDPFDQAGKSQIYRMTAYRNNFNIEIRWTMPPLHEHYRTKPHHYLARILRHEGRGSLFSYLEQKKWCIDLSAGIGNYSFENNSLYTTFVLSLTVTEEGNQHMWQVIDAVYAYIKMMRKEGPRKSIYDEIQKVEAKRFRFRPKKLNEDIFEICTVARLYPPADCITGRVLYFDYNPDTIKSCLDLLTPERSKIIYLEYSENPWDSSMPEAVKTNGTVFVNRWKTVAPIPGLHLPEANAFITEDYPVKIHDDDFSEIWFKRYRQDAGETCMKIQYMSPLPFASTNNCNGLNLFVSILKNLLSNEHCEVHRSPHGLWVEAEDYGRGLSLLMKKVSIYITHCWHLITEDLFDEKKKVLQKSYLVDMKNPTKLAENLESAILYENYERRVDLRESLCDLDFHEFREFVKNFTVHMRIQCFVQGSMRAADIIETTRKCVEIINCQPLSPSALLPTGTNKIPRGVRCLRVQSFDRTCADSVVLNVYQFGPPSAKLAAMIDCFCYVVMGYLPTEDYLVDEFKASQFGYTITSETCKSKTVEEIDEDIEDYRGTVYASFKGMETEDLLNIKDAMIEEKMKEWAVLDEDLTKKAKANWNTIMEREYDFNVAQRLLDIIDSMTLEELRASMMQLSSNITGRGASKLSIQIVGHNEPTTESTVAGAEKAQELNEYALKYLTRLPEDKKKPRGNYYITDYKHFKSSLKFCPLERFSVQRSSASMSD